MASSKLGEPRPSHRSTGVFLQSLFYEVHQNWKSHASVRRDREIKRGQ
jgi:hypothetical protein